MTLPWTLCRRLAFGVKFLYNAALRLFRVGYWPDGGSAFYLRGITMKADIHPNYKEVTMTCSCGNVIVTNSTVGKAALHLDVCSACHPFYTGKQKMVDTAGRVDRFRQKYGIKT